MISIFLIIIINKLFGNFPDMNQSEKLEKK